MTVVLSGEPAHFTGNWNQLASSAATNTVAVREMSHPGSQFSVEGRSASTSNDFLYVAETVALSKTRFDTTVLRFN